MSPVLQAESISVQLGSKTLLDQINLSLESGEAVALVGPNGAGKSTLLRVLAGEIKPRFGRVRLDGQELASYSPQRLADHRAVLSQQVNIVFPFTVADVVRMGAGHHHGEKTDALVGETLAELDLLDLASHAITTLSGGERQRAHFARVLVQLACGRNFGGLGILLLDEPTNSLDLRHQLGMLEILRRRAAQGALIIAVFHDLNLASVFATRIVVLNRGRIDCDGSPHETITDRTLKRVFGIEMATTKAIALTDPVVLPQTMTVVKHFST